MTPREQQIAIALSRCRFLPGSQQKRFVRDMADKAKHGPAHELTIKQQRYLGILWYQYRVQSWEHDSTAPEHQLTRLERIAKGIDGCDLVYRGIKNGRVVELEAVEYYFCREAGISDVALACLEQAPVHAQLELREGLCANWGA
jgi:hypothetical protein